MTGNLELRSTRNISAIEAAYASWNAVGADLASRRVGYDAMPPTGPRDVSVEEGVVAGVRGRWMRPRADDGSVVLFLHGGGYNMGSSLSHGELGARLALSARASLFIPDYSLAPEHPFPTGLHNVQDVYRELTSTVGPLRMAVVGDSAGGGLTLATLLLARDEGFPMPACAVTMSAWTDLALTGESITGRAELDPLVTRDDIAELAAGYLGGHDPRDPLVSPLYGDFAGLPPLLVQVGTDEILLDDSLRLAQRAIDAGVDVELDVADGMAHVYQLLTWLLPEASAAIERAGAYIRARTGEHAD